MSSSFNNIFAGSPPLLSPSSAFDHDDQDLSNYSYMTFTECLQGAGGGVGMDDYTSLLANTCNSSLGGFLLSPSSSSAEANHQKAAELEGSGECAQNSSISSSSCELAEEQDSGTNNNKKVQASHEEEEEVKAAAAEEEEDVEGSTKKGSYYRCTTQKCRVKKRVERSYEDPTTVITTYEGQHNHPVPTSLRAGGNAAAAAAMFTCAAPPSISMLLNPPLLTSLLPSSNSPPFFLHNNYFINNNNNTMISSPNPTITTTAAAAAAAYNYNNNNSVSSSLLQHHDYGLLQDMVPSMFLKQEP
ncbi:putative WRKY transcription factor 71 [Senna tora]|uniref:Putative WRKY transcription factor 71 n=1 Tax=Senna tora TaxID=362788 RepID=A0A834SFU0_9FABA|nr:putative WRKY transcription factor 71 [Senna tora]